MNCLDVRQRLPDLVYDGCTADERANLDSHLATCTDCQNAAKELRQVRLLLDQAQAPAVRVDVAAVYRVTAEENARRGRRMRRRAIGFGIAAAVLFVVVLGRLEFRVDSNQLVVRWGTPPAPAPTPAESERILVREEPRPVPDEKELRELASIVQSLATDAQRRDDVHAREMARLREQFDELRRRSSDRWAVLERDISALYTAHFSSPKGGNP